MQAHANDLRSEIESGWDTVVDTARAGGPNAETCDAFVHQVVNDWRECPLTSAMRLLTDYAERVTQTPAKLSETDIHGLRREGWSDRAIHDAVQVIAYFNYINRVADALGVVPEEGLQQWGAAED